MYAVRCINTLCGWLSPLQKRSDSLGIPELPTPTDRRPSSFLHLQSGLLKFIKAMGIGKPEGDTYPRDSYDLIYLVDPQILADSTTPDPDRIDDFDQ